MPLPMPRSVMSSPIHMMTPVPAVMVMTMSRMAYQASLVMSWRARRGAASSAEQRAAAGDRDERGRLQDAERDGEVAGVLGQRRLAGLALLVEGVEVWDDHAQQLHDDRRRDVRHDAEREDRELEQRAAAEQVDEVVEAAACPSVAARQVCTFPKSTNGAGMNDPSRNSATMPSVNPIFLRRSGVRKIRATALNTRPPGYNVMSSWSPPGSRWPRSRGRRHDGYGDYLIEPPAATIFCSAEPETLSTATFSLTAMSPSPRTLTFSFLRTAPLATRSPMVTSPPFG